MAFSYEDLTSASQPFYEKLLALDAAKFEKWRTGTTAYNASLSVDTAFYRWWQAKGRLDFKSFDDTRRYRRELLELIVQQTIDRHFADGRAIPHE